MKGLEKTRLYERFLPDMGQPEIYTATGMNVILICN